MLKFISLAKHLSTEATYVKRPIQRRNVYKGGDKRNRDSLRVERGSSDKYDTPDGQIIAKSAPGSGRTSPTEFLNLSLGPKAWTPSSMSNPPIEAKVVILGAQSVGKTSIVLRYVGKVFSNRVNSTIGASFFTFTMDIDNTKVKIQLWDTAGQERFRSMAPMYYRRANAAVIVYDITNSKSFDQAKEWVAELYRTIGTDIALCVVGNKTDLPKELRKVSTEKGKEFAKSLNSLFAETSAAHDTGIKEMFTQVAMRVMEQSKIENDSKHYSYSSYTSSQVMSASQVVASTPNNNGQQNKQHQQTTATTTPNITLTSEQPKKGGCWCWR